jgi:hypothetical protein
VIIDNENADAVRGSIACRRGGAVRHVAHFTCRREHLCNGSGAITWVLLLSSARPRQPNVMTQGSAGRIRYGGQEEK